jgi:sugar lactone lactonase YvrE
MTTRTLDAEIAFPAQCELAEGPLWDASRGLLRWVDRTARTCGRSATSRPTGR